MFKAVVGGLVLLLIILQYALWLSPGGIVQIWRLKQQMTVIQEGNAQLAQRNAMIEADINDLKQGYEAIEERARNDLGMIKKGEVFYQVVK